MTELVLLIGMIVAVAGTLVGFSFGYKAGQGLPLVKKPPKFDTEAQEEPLIDMFPEE